MVDLIEGPTIQWCPCPFTMAKMWKACRLGPSTNVSLENQFEVLLIFVANTCDQLWWSYSSYFEDLPTVSLISANFKEDCINAFVQPFFYLTFGPACCIHIDLTTRKWKREGRILLRVFSRFWNRISQPSIYHTAWRDYRLWHMLGRLRNFVCLPFLTD